jgi:DNA-directed RNA polymerase specialized sigma24 family protein
MMHHQEKAAEEYPLALLYQKYARAVLSYLDRRISIKEDAEDLLLEVFLAALENQVWTTLTDGEQLAWLRRVARNKLIDHYRQKTRHVDEQIDKLLRTPQQQEPANSSPAQMVHMLQGIYEEDPRLQRVWERLADHLPTTRSTGESGENGPLSVERFSQTSSSTIVRFPQEKVVGMQTQTRISVQSHKRGSL